MVLVLTARRMNEEEDAEVGLMLDELSRCMVTLWSV